MRHEIIHAYEGSSHLIYLGWFWSDKLCQFTNNSLLKRIGLSYVFNRYQTTNIYKNQMAPARHANKSFCPKNLMLYGMKFV